MDNTNNPTEKPAASNTPDGQEQVSSVVPNGYKQRGNGSTFLVVMLIFLVLGGIVSFIYFKLDSSVGSFKDVGKQIVEFFENIDIDDDDDDDNVRPVINLDDLDISDGLDDIDMPDINMPSQSDLDSATDAIYEQRANMLGYDTEILMSNYFTLEEPDMKLMHEESYGYYYYEATNSDMSGIHSIELYAIADPEEKSIGDYVVAQYKKQSPFSKMSAKTVNGRLWRGFAKKSGNLYIYYWFAEEQGKIFKFTIQSFDLDESLYADVLEDAQ